MNPRWACFALAALAACSWPAQAAFHLFRIDQVFSNADGSIQYVVMREAFGANNEHFWAGQSLAATDRAGARKQITFPTNLPSSNTANRSVLIATPGFAALGLVAPDYTIPERFLPTDGGTLDFANGTDTITLPVLPTDGSTATNRNGMPVPATPKNFAGDSATLVLPPPSTSTDLNQHGLTGSWFEPATSGQGIELEVFPSVRLIQGAWFTFDTPPAGGVDRQRWYTFSGNAQAGIPNAPVTIYLNQGGNFNAPPITSATVVGSGVLSFADCVSGTLEYTFSDATGRSGSIPLTRLTPNVTCTAGGAAPVTDADFAFSGNWYDPATSGQGFVFEVNPLAPVFFLTWYTYAPAGQGAGAAGLRWFTGQASYTAGSRSIALTLFETTGGAFDQPTNPPPATVPVGTATVSLMSCTSAQLQFNFNGGSNAGRSGTIALARVGPTPPGCVAATEAITPPSDPPMTPPPGYPYGGAPY